MLDMESEDPEFIEDFNPVIDNKRLQHIDDTEDHTPDVFDG